METRYLKLASSLFLVFVATFTVVNPVFAQGNTVRDSGSGSGITNPLGGGQDQTITSVLSGVIKWMLGLVGFLALIALIVGGGRMIIDFGNEDQVRKAKMTITWAVIGLLVVMLSYAIVNIVTNEILGAGGNSSGNNSSSGL
jgi:hypothetical protein